MVASQHNRQVQSIEARSLRTSKKDAKPQHHVELERSIQRARDDDRQMFNRVNVRSSLPTECWFG